jgi:hypothetical protein
MAVTLERPIRVGDFIQQREAKLFYCCGFVWKVTADFVEYEQPICGDGWRVRRDNWWSGYRRLNNEQVHKLFDQWLYRYLPADRVAAYHKRWMKL